MQFRRSWPKFTLVQTLIGSAVCLLVALMAQRALDQYTGQRTPWVYLAALGLAGIAFAMLTREISAETNVDEAEPPQPAPISLGIVVVTVGISVLGCLNFGQNRFRLPGVLVWTGGLALTLLYLWLISPGPRQGRLLRTWWEERKVWVPVYAVLLLAIVLLGAWFRLRLNGQIPAEMGFDLAGKYTDALAISRGEYSIFFPARRGREGLFYYSVALVGRLAGVSEATLHLTSALWGTLTIIAVYLLARELYGRTAGLLAALLLAINRWHIVISRSGYRASTMPLFIALTLFTLIRALRTRKPLDFGWAGVAVGAGIYTYRSFLFVPFALVLGLVLYVLSHGRQLLRQLLPGLVVMVLIAAAIVAPLARFVLEYPEVYLAREFDQLKAVQAQTVPSPGLVAYYTSSLLAFNFRGDADARFNVPFARVMGLTSGVLLVLGLAYALWRWRRGYNAILLPALFGLILPAALSMLPSEMPSSLRMSGAIVPAVVLAVVPVAAVQQLASPSARGAPQGGIVTVATASSQHKANSDEQSAPGGDDNRREEAIGVSMTVRTGKRRRTWALEGSGANALGWMLAAFLIFLLAFETSETRQYYFRDYVAHLPDRSNYSVAVDVARQIKQYGDLRSVFVMTRPGWLDSSVLQLHVGTDESWYPFFDTLAPDQPPLSTLHQTALFIINAHDPDSLATLRAAFPRVFVQAHSYPDGELAFYTCLVEP